MTIYNQLVYNRFTMLNKEIILEKLKEKGEIRTKDLVKEFGLTRQYVSRLIGELANTKKLIQVGKASSTFYILPESINKYKDKLEKNQYSKVLINKGLEEHIILSDIEKNFQPFSKLPENIKSIFTYAFSEMLNNAIEHSTSDKIHVIVDFINKQEICFIIEDYGIGVYRNIMKARSLNSEMEAIQDLLKGKLTTAPKLHSGEGIFFTSKVGDEFILNSYGYQLIINNKIDDLFVKKIKGIKMGTRVTFRLNIQDTHHLNDIFKRYTDQSEDSNYGFDKTEIHIKLYMNGGIHISRSQARRILTNLEKFKIIIMDYDKVPMIGQAFADEIYRVFRNKYPEIQIKDENTNEAVAFMIQRAKNEAQNKYL